MLDANKTISRFSSRTRLERIAARKARLKVLVVRVRLLHPLDSGGKIRTAKLLQELGKENDVTLVAYRYPEDTEEDVTRTRKMVSRLVTVPFSEAPKKSLRFYCGLGLNLFQPLPYIVSKYASARMASTVARVHEEDLPDLVLCDFLQSCEALRKLPGVPFVLFQHNVEAAIFEQLAERADSIWSRAYLRLQARRLRAYERKQCLRAQEVIGVSSVDSETFAKRYGVTRCAVVPTGVDTEYYRPSATARVPNNLVFTGSMDWLANQDAMLYFAAEIFPRIQAEIPNVALSIVGRNPPPRIRKLGETPGIHVTGTVSDIRPYVHGAKVYVVPLRIGSGTRLKLLEAMAMGKAIVSTGIGAEGLPVEHGHNIVLADTPAAFAAETVALLRDRERRGALGLNARETAERDHAWPQVGRVFNEICYRAAITARDMRA